MTREVLSRAALHGNWRVVDLQRAAGLTPSAGWRRACASRGGVHTRCPDLGEARSAMTDLLRAKLARALTRWPMRAGRSCAAAEHRRAARADVEPPATPTTRLRPGVYALPLSAMRARRVIRSAWMGLPGLDGLARGATGYGLRMLRPLALATVILPALLLIGGCSGDSSNRSVPDRGGHAMTPAAGGGDQGFSSSDRNASAPGAGERTVEFRAGDRLYKIAESIRLIWGSLIRRNDLVTQPQPGDLLDHPPPTDSAGTARTHPPSPPGATWRSQTL